MSREQSPQSFDGPLPDDHLQLRREKIVRRFRLYSEVTKEIRRAYAANGVNPTQAVRLYEPDTRAWRGQIQPLSRQTDGAYGFGIFQHSSTGQERYFLNLKFRVIGFTGLIATSDIDNPKPLHVDHALDVLAPIAEYCEWDAIPTNVPYKKIDFRPIIQATREQLVIPAIDL